MRIIDTTDEFLQERTYDDLNPELEGFKHANKERYRIVRWVDQEMATAIESFLLED